MATALTCRESYQYQEGDRCNLMEIRNLVSILADGFVEPSTYIKLQCHFAYLFGMSTLGIAKLNTRKSIEM